MKPVQFTNESGIRGKFVMIVGNPDPAEKSWRADWIGAILVVPTTGSPTPDRCLTVGLTGPSKRANVLRPFMSAFVFNDPNIYVVPLDVDFSSLPDC